MDNETIRQACYHIIDALWVCDNIEKLPNCNNCRLKDECEYCPVAGEMVRVNCFNWESEEDDREIQV